MLSATIVRRLRSLVAQRPEATAYVRLGETEPRALSFGELDLKARSVAAHLRDLTRPGDRVLVVSQDIADHMTGLFGCLYAGVVPVSGIPPYLPRLGGPSQRHGQRAARLSNVLESSGARVVVGHGQFLDDFQRASQPLLAHRALGWLRTDHATGLLSDTQVADPADTDIALLQYTSGSTGAPRGVAITHANLMHNLLLQTKVGLIGPEAVCVSWLPPYHDMGLIYSGFGTIYAGCRTIVMSPVHFAEDPLRWLDAITQFGGTVSAAPNFAYSQCVARATPERKAQLDLRTWTLALNGAEPVSAKVMRAFTAEFADCGLNPLAPRATYGLAEATLFVSGPLPGRLPRTLLVDRDGLRDGRAEPAAAAAADAVELVGCGASPPGMEVRIVDPATGAVLPENRVGEICCHSPSIASGYFNDPEATASGLRADVAGLPHLRTGDLGFLRDGELYFTGRLKDLVILQGVNHYPQDIESVSEASHPALQPTCSAAFSIAAEDSERLVVVAECRRAHEADANEAMAAVRRALLDELGVRVDEVVLIRQGGVAKTPSGKIQRLACRQALERDALAIVGRWRAEEASAEIIEPGERPATREAVVALVTRVLAAEVTFEGGADLARTPLGDFGFNSLKILELAGTLRKQVGVRVKAADLFVMKSVDELCDYVWAAVQRGPAPPAPRLVGADEAHGAAGRLRLVRDEAETQV